MPDGSGLLVQYQDLSVGPNRNQIGFVSYPSGQFHTITKDTNSYVTLTLSADAKTLATVQSKRLFTLYAIPASGTGANPPTPTIPQQQKGLMSFTWAGNEGFYLVEDNHLVRVSSDGSNRTSLLNSAPLASVSACPDGRTLIVDLDGQGGVAGTNVWRVNTDGTNLKRLSNGQRDTAPECSGDSKWAYYLDVTTSRLERVPLDGGTPEIVPGTPIPHALINGHFLDFSPDGKWVALMIDSGDANTISRIALIPLDAGSQPQVRFLDPNPTSARSATPSRKCDASASAHPEIPWR